MKVDLHCHTHYSDGKHDLSYLKARALDNGLSHLAITDHDCVDALLTAEPVDGLAIIPGVEISCVWENNEIHVVGLCINASDPGLGALLAEQQASRYKRIVKIDEKLRQQGAGELLESLSGLKASVLTRSHVADYLVENGVCASRRKVFKRYLNKGGKAHVPAEWCSMLTAISAIKGAGGIAILAHPGRYPLNRAKLKRLVETFRQLGGEALEASYPNIAPEMKQYLEKLGVEFSMYLSCGSDFHDAAATWTDVGKLPALSAEVAEHVVWQHPVWKARVDAV